MTHSSPTRAEDGSLPNRIADWASSLSRRRIGSLLLLLAALLILATYLLQATLTYPAVLLAPASLAQALVAQAAIGCALGFVFLLASGGILVVVSRGLASSMQEPASQRIFATGVVAGTLWGSGAFIGLLLLPLWGHAPAGLSAVLAAYVLAMVEMAAPLGLAIWTVALSRELRAHRVLAWVGAIGLLFVAGRSLLWLLNARLPIASGFYGTAGVLSLIAVLGMSFWLFWVLLLGFRLLGSQTREGMRAPEATVAPASAGTVARRLLLRGALGLGVGVAGLVFVGARTGFTVAASPELAGDGIPAEPSLAAGVYYLIAMLYAKVFHPIHTVAELPRDPTAETPPSPDKALEQLGVNLAPLEVNGVPAERISAPGVSSSRWILYIHGGGFTVPGTNDNRAFVGRLSKVINATALYPNYRLTPEHPYPAGLNDCVAAYRWLRQQGIPGSHIVIAGESAGGNLTLATALVLHESGEEAPAALVAISPATDMAMTGETYRTKDFADPLTGGGLAQDAFAVYTNHGATDLRDPHVSPLYANVSGFSPTMIQASTQDVFLSDATRMAEKLSAAGVTVKLEVWPGMMHAFAAGAAVIPEAKLATQHIATFMRRYLGG